MDQTSPVDPADETQLPDAVAVFNRDHGQIIGAIKRLKETSIVALVVVDPDDDGSGEETAVHFMGVDCGREKLGLLQTGIAVVQDDLFD